MHSKMMGLAVILGMMSLPAFAEPALQPGETLESLSKVRINTTVNGQPGSLKQLAASGQIKLAEELPVSIDEIDSVELESPATATQTTTPAAPAKTVAVAAQAEPAAKPAESAAKAVENAPAVATEALVNVEEIDQPDPTA